MKFNFKKIRQVLMFTGLLINTSLEHNVVQAMEIPFGMSALPLSDHRAVANNFINTRQIPQVLFTGACYYGGVEEIGGVRDLEIARIYFESAAEKDSDVANFFLKKIRKEQNNPVNNLILDERMKEILKFAAHGEIVMQYNLANAYYMGNGFPKDYEGALFWGKKASSHKILENHQQKQKQLECQSRSWFLVASIYDYEEGEYCDFQQAFKYFKLAADSPYASSIMFYEVGVKYLIGEGVEFDNNLAMRYLGAAKDKGHKAAINRLDDIENLKISLRYISIAKGQGDKKTLGHQGKCFYDRFNESFNKLKNIKYTNNSPINDMINGCSSMLVLAVECDYSIAKVIHNIIVKGDKFPGIDQEYFNLLKKYIFKNEISIKNMREIICLEGISSQPRLIVQKPNNTSSSPKHVRGEQQSKTNNSPLEKNGKNTNHNNTTSNNRNNKNQIETKNQPKVSMDSSELLKAKITQTKKELNQNKTTKKSLQSALVQKQNELKQEKGELESQNKKLTEISASRKEYEKQSAEIKNAKEKLISEIEKLKVNNLADVSYEVELSSIVKESQSKEPESKQHSFSVSKVNNSPKNNELSRFKSEKKTEEKFLENPHSLQITNLEMVEKKEIKDQQGFSYNNSEKKQSVIKTLKTKVKKWNDNREDISKKHEEKRELKKNKKKTNISPGKIGNLLETGGEKTLMVSNSVSQTIEESSFSVTENESQFSITEVSEAEKTLPIEGVIICEEMKKVYPKLYRLLNKRDASCLNLIKLKSSTLIYDTLLNMCSQGIVCGSWDGKNIHVQKKHYQDIVFNEHTTHGSSNYTKWYHNPKIVVDFITFVADCDDIIKDFCIWKFGENCFSRLSNDSAEAANTSKPE